MDGSDSPIWFLGDLDDAWVNVLLKSVRSVDEARAVPCREGLPEGLLARPPAPRALVLHRSQLTPDDVSVIEGWRAAALPEPPLRILVCYGPFVRHAELERCGRAVDLMLPEATACDTLPGQLRGLLGDSPREFQDGPDATKLVEVISTEHALREVLCEACSAAGYRVAGRMWPELDEPQGEPSVEANRDRSLTIWDVPVLEPHWPESLRSLSRRGPVVALLGFADRATVELAREHGAAVCLDVPLNFVDLYRSLDVLARTVEFPAEARGEAGHDTPFRPVHVLSRGRDANRNREPKPLEWPNGSPTPKITS